MHKIQHEAASRQHQYGVTLPALPIATQFLPDVPGSPGPADRVVELCETQRRSAVGRPVANQQTKHFQFQAGAVDEPRAALVFYDQETQRSNPRRLRVVESPTQAKEKTDPTGVAGSASAVDG